MGKSQNTDASVEARILTSARELFTTKGYANTNMREIADHAGVNKGLIHYYRWNKSKLFLIIFAEAFQGFAKRANALFSSELGLLEKIEAFVDGYMDFLAENPQVPGFVIHELHSNAETFIPGLLDKIEPPDPSPFVAQFEAEARAGNIRRFDPLQFFLHLLSMCVFPFVAGPMFKAIFHLPPEEYDRILAARKNEVLDFALAALYGRGDANQSE